MLLLSVVSLILDIVPLDEVLDIILVEVCAAGDITPSVNSIELEYV